MKQTLVMILATAFGTIGVVFMGPFAAVAVYYLFAVLRPQYMWEWVLPRWSWSEYVAIAAMLGTIGLLLTGGERPRLRFSWAHRFYLLFGCWLCCSYFTALSRDWAWIWLLEYLKIFAMFTIAAIVIRDVRQAKILYLVATFALVYIAYEINFLYVFQHRLDIYHRGYGGLDNNGAGLMMAIGVPLAIFAWEGTRQWWRWGFLAAVPLLLHAVLMSYSRGAMLSLVLAAPLIWLRSHRRWQFAGLAVLLAVLIPFLAGNEIRARFFTTANYTTDASTNSRFESWRAAVRIARDYPIFGVGIRNSLLLSGRYGADYQLRAIHSQYLQLLADNGFIGLLLYLAAIASLWIGMLRTRRLLRKRGRDDPEAAATLSFLSGLEAALAVFFVGSAFLSLEVFELPYLLALLGAQVTVLVRTSVAAGEEDQVQVTEGVAPACPLPDPAGPHLSY